MLNVSRAQGQDNRKTSFVCAKLSYILFFSHEKAIFVKKYIVQFPKSFSNSYIRLSKKTLGLVPIDSAANVNLYLIMTWLSNVYKHFIVDIFYLKKIDAIRSSFVLAIAIVFLRAYSHYFALLIQKKKQLEQEKSSVKFKAEMSL